MRPNTAAVGAPARRRSGGPREDNTTDSHVAVMKEALRLGLNWVRIYEDDAILPDVDMHKTIKAVDAEVDGDWGVVIHGHKTKNIESRVRTRTPAQ
mgnify:CR=1 FL=1